MRITTLNNGNYSNFWSYDTVEDISKISEDIGYLWLL